MRVLVVEDEEPIASAIERGLTKIGYAVDVAYDGAEALEQAGVNAYDVVCLDLNLPRVDGVEVCRKLRADHFRGGIIMLTARSRIRDRVEGLDEVLWPAERHPDERPHLLAVDDDGTAPTVRLLLEGRKAACIEAVHPMLRLAVTAADHARGRCCRRSFAERSDDAVALMDLQLTQQQGGTPSCQQPSWVGTTASRSMP